MQYLMHIKKFFAALTNPYPVRDWYLALGIAALGMCALIGVSVYFFIGIQAGFIVGEQSASQEVTASVSREGLLRTLETYQTRTVNFDGENYPVPDITDPSR